MGLQRAGQQALQQAIDTNPPSTAGAFVAMNPDNGEVYAMGSLPTFDPNIFTKPVPESVYQQLNNPSSNFPLINRAVQEFNDYQRLTSEGKLAEAGKKLEEHKRTLEELRKATGKPQ